MTTRTSSFIKSDSQYHRISKQMGGGFERGGVWGMQITRKRDGELEDERRRGGGEGCEWRRCVCVWTKTEAERGKQAVCMWRSPSQPLHFESTDPRRPGSLYRPQRGSAHQLCRANFTLNRLWSQVGGGELCACWLTPQWDRPSAATQHPHKRRDSAS